MPVLPVSSSEMEQRSLSLSLFKKISRKMPFIIKLSVLKGSPHQDWAKMIKIGPAKKANLGVPCLSPRSQIQQTF